MESANPDGDKPVWDRSPLKSEGKMKQEKISSWENLVIRLFTSSRFISSLKMNSKDFGSQKLTRILCVLLIVDKECNNYITDRKDNN